jgi:hypothetical protein
LTVSIAGFVAGYAVHSKAEMSIANKKAHANFDMCRRIHIEFHFGFQNDNGSVDLQRSP